MRPLRVLLIDALSFVPQPDTCQRFFDSWKDTGPKALLDVSQRRLTEIGNETLVPDAVVLHGEGELPLQEFRRVVNPSWEAVPLIGAFCGALCPDMIQKALDLGLDDFVTCPVTGPDLIPRLRRLIKPDRATFEPFHTTSPLANFRVESLVGESEVFLRQVEQIPLLAGSDATVLIGGETGTGKELFARAIHYHSSRQGKPFIPVNCGALPDQLFENELFGHERGAFTNAYTRQAGLVEEAEGGTLFLDEIDTLSLTGQTKLLRFLQDKQYRPLGRSKNKAADVRVIVATNTDLRQRVIEKLFREDLFYRLNVIMVTVPPLRERIEDIPLLARHFLKTFGAQQGKQSLVLASSAIRTLLSYSWPGNVRELEGLIQRAVLLTKTATIHPEELAVPSQTGRQQPLTGSLRAAKSSVLREFERSYLAKTMAIAKGNVSQAARTAGKERRTFQRLLQKHRIDRHDFLSLP